METVEIFRKYLIQEEKSELTVEKYVRDVLRFLTWQGEAELTKNRTLAYKAEMVEDSELLFNGIQSSDISVLGDYREFYMNYSGKESTMEAGLEKCHSLPFTGR